MADSLHRAVTLMDVRRFAEARQAAQEALAHEPNSAAAHLVMAEASLHLDEPQAAIDSAEQAIAAAPDLAPAFIMRARGRLARHQPKEARPDLERALELEPHDAQTFGLLAWTHVADRNWREALEAAEQGLQEDPEETNCVNARARALMYLKQPDRAFETIHAALAQDPDDAYTHANAGWAKLQARDRDAALEHFSQSLRRDPSNEYARQGLITAMKAKNPVYGALLSYTFFMAGLKPGAQFAIVIGALVIYNVVFRSLLAAGLPLLAVIVIALYLSFVLLTWAGDAIFNALLLFNRHGRQILSASQKAISVTVGATVASGFGLMGYAVLMNQPFFFTGLGFLLVCLPLAYAGRLRGKNQKIALGVAGGCATALLASIALTVTGFDPEKSDNLRDLAILALVAFNWIGPSALKH